MSHPPAAARLPALDIARSAAILAMVVFHATVDLEMLGQLPAGLSTGPGWSLFARLTATSFLALSGISFWLAVARGLQPRRFWSRLARIAAAAALVSLATWLAMPERWVYFGILHAMAACTVLGLLVHRAPWPVIAGLAALVWIAPAHVAWTALDARYFWWIGLGTVYGRAMDFVPVFPWAAPFLAGLAACKALCRPRVQAPDRAPDQGPSRWQQWLAFPGRHSLAIYLLHQPLIYGFFWLVLRLFG